MVEATFVVYAPKAQLAKVRGLVQSQTPEAVTWRERRTLFGSEFYVTGPASLAREAHELAARPPAVLARPARMNAKLATSAQAVMVA